MRWASRSEAKVDLVHPEGKFFLLLYMGKRVISKNHNDTGKAALIGGGAAALGGAVAGAGGVTVSTCPPEDKSFYCQFVKGFNIFKMILSILLILAVIGVIAWVFLKK